MKKLNKKKNPRRAIFRIMKICSFIWKQEDLTDKTKDYMGSMALFVDNKGYYIFNRMYSIQHAIKKFPLYSHFVVINNYAPVKNNKTEGHYKLLYLKNAYFTKSTNEFKKLIYNYSIKETSMIRFDKFLEVLNHFYSKVPYFIIPLDIFIHQDEYIRDLGNIPPEEYFDALPNRTY